jgi:hypothetical protein
LAATLQQLLNSYAAAEAGDFGAPVVFSIRE